MRARSRAARRRAIEIRSLVAQPRRRRRRKRRSVGPTAAQLRCWRVVAHRAAFFPLRCLGAGARRPQWSRGRTRRERGIGSRRGRGRSRGVRGSAMNRKLLLLALCQGFFLTNNVTFIAINGLVGLRLAPNAWMATLPVTAYVAGSALFAGLVARHQRAWGRRRAFQLGLGVAIATTALCAWAALNAHFWWLVAGATLAGYYNANAGLYRFAATELVVPALKDKAISWVLAGGIIGALAGPNLARATKSALPAEFAGAYAALAVVALASLATISLIRFPPLAVPTRAVPGRRLAEIAAQPVFIVAVMACALGYGVMNLLMAATPIAMAMCAHPFDNTALVLEWHVLGMFVPSFFTGSLIRRFGALRILAI